MEFLQSRVASFGYAFKGLGVLVATQRNAQVHLVATTVVVALGLYLEVSPADWCLLAFAMSGVWVSEALNTAVEFLADAAVPEQHPLVGKAKDVAAGAVLLAALGALVVGAVVFGSAGVGSR